MTVLPTWHLPPGLEWPEAERAFAAATLPVLAPAPAQLGALAPLVDWTSEMAGFWQSRFNDLEDLLKRMDQ